VRELISHYRILKELDATELRRVYLVEDRSLGKVVVRLFRDASAEGDAEEFLRSAQAWIDLNHPNIAPILDTLEDDGRLFVVTPFVEGTPLSELMRRGQVPKVDALGLMRDLASALAYLHRRGIVHGDLHPSRLMVDLGGRIQIVDLRFERLVPRELVDADAARYDSPERLTGAAIDSRSDIFGFGAILHEILTSRLAFPGTDVAQVLNGILSAPPDLLQVSSSLDATVVRMIEGCLRRDPKRRCQDLDEAVNDLEAARQKAEGMATLVAHARQRLADTDYSAAIDACERALLLEPDNESTRELLGQARAAIEAADAGGEPRARQEPVRVFDENVQFTVYRRSVVAPGRWYPMLAFAHLAKRRPDTSPHEPDPVAEVQRQAKQVLGDDAADFQRVVQDSMRPIPARGHLRFLPNVEDVEFNPLERSFRWTEPVHREEFRLKASRALDGRVARGVVSVYLGHLLVAEIPVAIRVDSQEVAAEPVADDARPYRRIFASYSHRDTEIVEEFADHVQSLGDEYLRDVTQLRSGEAWTPRLMQLIASADVFQLFWSWNSLQSPFVRAEWEYALALRRDHYIRPVYWEDPLPSTGDLPPESLRALHFKQIRPRSVVPVSKPLDSNKPRDRAVILTLEVTSPRASDPGDVSRHTFSREGGSIGRDRDNSWILPHRRISGHHALISCRNGVYYLEDTSRNGVCLNSPANRLVRGRPYALKVGDSILIDPYEIRVSITPDQSDTPGRGADDWPGVLSTSDQVDVARHSESDDPFAPVAISSSEFDLGSEANAGQTVDPLELLGVDPKPALVRKAASVDDFEHDPLSNAHFQPPAAVPAPGSAPLADPMTIPEGYDPLAPEDPARGPFPSLPDPPSEESAAGRLAEGRVAPPLPIPAPAGVAEAALTPEVPPSVPDRPRVATDDDASAGLAVVLTGAGLNPADLTPELARDFGEILRVVVSGVIDVMQARQQIKEEFGLRTRRVRHAERNPLKFSVDVHDALHNLLVKRNPVYLTPVAAFEDAFADLRDHQMAMLAGMRAAFESMLAEFDPDRLQQEFDRQRVEGLTPAKFRYWELYRQRLEDFLKDPDTTYRRLFGEAFAQAYEDQLRRLNAERSSAKGSVSAPAERND